MSSVTSGVVSQLQRSRPISPLQRRVNIEYGKYRGPSDNFMFDILRNVTVCVSVRTYLTGVADSQVAGAGWDAAQLR